MKGRASREPSFDREFVEALGYAFRLDFTCDGVGNLSQTFGPEDVFNYLCAVLHSQEYRSRYADFLKSDFSRLLLPADRELFANLLLPGARLLGLHLMETEGMDTQETFPNNGSNHVDRVHYTPPKSGLPGRVWINHEQFFGSVEPQFWSFIIGGCRPAEK